MNNYFSPFYHILMPLVFLSYQNMQEAVDFTNKSITSYSYFVQNMGCPASYKMESNTNTLEYIPQASLLRVAEDLIINSHPCPPEISQYLDAHWEEMF